MHELKNIPKYKVQLLRACHIKGEHYDAGDILDVEYRDREALLFCHAAIELQETEVKTSTKKKK